MSPFKAVLTRYESSFQGTFGKMVVEGSVFYTLELPDEDNASNYSCIPKGTYTCLWTHSEHFCRDMYEVTAVPGRAGIRIHSANLAGDDRKGWKKQLNGCIALGEAVGSIDGQKAILLSKPAIRRFEGILGGKEFILEVQ